MTTDIPFAPGSVSLGHYVHDFLPPHDIVSTFVDHAVLAVRSGFDGVTVSEHHAGYPTYLPNPLQATGWMLDAMPRGWAGAFPLLLPLRPPGVVVQELAWLHARHPGRVTAGFAAGYVQRDFDACGVPFADRNSRFRSSLDFVAAELSGPSERFTGDRVVEAAAAARIPMLVAAKGPQAVARAATLGFGLSVPLHDPAELAAVHEQYIAAGGTGPRVLMRWVWLGDPPESAIRSWEEAHTTSIDGGKRTEAMRVASAPDPHQLAAQVVEEMRAGGSTALSIRVHLPSVGPARAAEQIEAIGGEVVPIIRAMLAS
ncbi:LLM class flavin-dependent oxidoreductase [Rhodococcus sp. NPDC003318]|uniref:LLM class flavin-dependent oxidoreductase n=1 Tax=Rhodococcus sp. NPDC003318 TaxID=3364503 RepID=UPI003675D420